MHPFSNNPVGAAEPAKGFYEHSRDERIRMVRERSDQRATLMERWVHLNPKVSAGWIARAQTAAGLLKDAHSVLDIGCGVMLIEQYLQPNTRYIPMDVVRRDERTLVVDLNQHDLPSVDFDCALGLGVLEYLYDPARLLRAVAQHCRTGALFSYNPTDAWPSLEQRTADAWVSHLSVQQLEHSFTQAGFSHRCVHVDDAGQRMWWLSPMG
jgi:SAM-dependent methyltransferase